jgi:mRNA interferase RelE/StbE
MASYRLEITASAERALVGLPKADRVRVVGAIEELARVPRPSGCRKLKGQQDVYRIRVGRYRVIYAVEDRSIVVVVLRLGHRRDVYR